MCGIVGLFLKDKSLEPELGALLSSMLVTMTDRGPDSAGIAIYGDASGSNAKITIQSANPKKDFAGLEAELGQAVGARVAIREEHACRHHACEGPARRGQGSRCGTASEHSHHEQRRRHRDL